MSHPTKINAKRIRKADIMVYAKDFLLLERKGEITSKAQALTYLAVASLDPFEEWIEGEKITTKISKAELRHYKILTGDHDSRDLDKIKDLTEGYSLWLKDPITGEVGWASPFPYVGIDPNNPNEIIIDINDRVTQYFVGLSRWMDIVTLENVTLNIKKQNSRRLYLLLRSKLHRTSQSYTWEVSLETLKTELGLLNKYLTYKSFKSKVLSPAITEMGGNWGIDITNPSTIDFRVSITEVTQGKGKKVTGFIFLLSQDLNNSDGILVFDDGTIQPELF